MDSEQNHPKNNSVFSAKKQKDCHLNHTSPRVVGHKWAGLDLCYCFQTFQDCKRHFWSKGSSNGKFSYPEVDEFEVPSLTESLDGKNLAIEPKAIL